MCKALLLILLWLTWVGLKKENKWVLGSGTRLFLPELLKPLQMEKLFHFVPSCVSHYDWNMEEGLLRRDLACRSIILVVYHFVILVILSLPVVDCRCPLMAIVGRWDSWTDIFLREPRGGGATGTRSTVRNISLEWGIRWLKHEIKPSNVEFQSVF